ncbi:MAG TPA: aldo/keto reductase [Kofleriaceae bacterium]|nr:aldo/keto reductase [Kofleriaceae bacterium]
MQHVFLGRTGVRVSSLCLGTMSFAGDADEAESGRIFARAREAGINFFDCADVYAKGRSEEVLGSLIAGCRDQVVIATKGYFPTSGDPNARGSSRYHLVRAVEASLRRLGTDRIDIYYLHRFDDATDLEDSLRALEMLIQQGKILYPAVSNFSAWQTVRALGIAERLGWAPIVVAQPMYNLAKRQAEVEILPMAQALGLGVCSYSPLGGGLLSGKYAPTVRPQDGRLVANKMYATRYADDAHYDLAASFTGLARELEVHPVSLAVAWVGAHPGITAPIIGARSVEQLEPALAAAEIAMTPELRDRISALSPAPSPATDRNEESSAFNFGRR